MEIEVSFKKYIPDASIMLGYFEILKKMNFIKDVKIIAEKGKEPTIEVIRHADPPHSENSPRTIYL